MRKSGGVDPQTYRYVRIVFKTSPQAAVVTLPYIQFSKNKKPGFLGPGFKERDFTKNLFVKNPHSLDGRFDIPAIKANNW